jgi:selenocysteine lyase/cysteine desulfurase
MAQQTPARHDMLSGKPPPWRWEHPDEGSGTREGERIVVAAGERPYDLAAVRSALPALRDVIYLNSGTEGIMAEPVLDAYLETLAFFERYGHYARTKLASEMGAARTHLAGMLNAAPEEIAISRNGTDGVSMVLGSYPLAAGDEILIGNEEHPAINYPAFALQSTRGVRVRRFRFEHDPAATLANFAAELTPRTRLAAFSHVSCETGTRTPAAAIIALAHERGVPVLLDGAQSFGVLRVDVKALDADFFTGSSHKWLCGPKGTGLLYIRRDRLAAVTPAYVGGGSLAEPFPHAAIDEPETIAVSFVPEARKFEYGMRNPATYAGLSRAIDYLAGLGWQAIEAHGRTMSDDLKQRVLATPGLRLQTPLAWEHSSAIVNLAVDGVTGADLSTRLWDDYHIVQRSVREPNGVRISCAYFVSQEDIDRLLDALIAIRDAT